jgi:zinc/manganese transport system permease protein
MASTLIIIIPALIAGLLVTATHVPLGIQVLSRGIVFIDLAIAQIAVVGVMLADWVGFEPQGWAVQVSALSAALLGALVLTWSEKKWPEVQEAIIGTVFVLAATGAVLLLAGNPHGGEHLKDLLVGQILWVRESQLYIVAVTYAVILAAWFGFGSRLGRVGFYSLFACTVTVSVQLVGLYLVFASLIIPALASRRMAKDRLAFAYLISAFGYVLGLAASVLTDLPSGAVIVWVMAILAAISYAITSRKPTTTF